MTDSVVLTVNRKWPWFKKYNNNNKTHTLVTCDSELLYFFFFLFFVFIVFCFPLDIEKEREKSKWKLKWSWKEEEKITVLKEMINWMRTSNKSHHNTTLTHSLTMKKRYRRFSLCYGSTHTTCQMWKHSTLYHLFFFVFFQFVCFSLHFETMLNSHFGLFDRGETFR